MPGTAAKLGQRSAKQPVEAAEARDQLTPEIDGALALHADAREDRQQFGIREHAGPCASRRSRGRSSAGQSVIAMQFPHVQLIDRILTT